MKKKVNMSTMTIDDIVRDGELTQDEALDALENAAESANEALPKAQAKCNTDAEREKVQTDRNIVVLSYVESENKALQHTGPLFEKMAEDLRAEAGSVKQKAERLNDAIEAINLFTDLVRLAASLALAFR